MWSNLVQGKYDSVFDEGDSSEEWGEVYFTHFSVSAQQQPQDSTVEQQESSLSAHGRQGRVSAKAKSAPPASHSPCMVGTASPSGGGVCLPSPGIPADL